LRRLRAPPGQLSLGEIRMCMLAAHTGPVRDSLSEQSRVRAVVHGPASVGTRVDGAHPSPARSGPAPTPRGTRLRPGPATPPDHPGPAC
jgi:hypothetical protein